MCCIEGIHGPEFEVHALMEERVAPGIMRKSSRRQGQNRNLANTEAGQADLQDGESLSSRLKRS